MSPKTLAWRDHAVAIGGVSLAVLDGTPISEGDAAGFHYVSQAKPPLHLDLWAGKDMSLAWWRGRFGNRNASIGAEAAIVVCGRPARRQEVTVPELRAEGLVPTASGLGHIEGGTPSEVHVAIAAAAADGTPFVVSWRVEASKRDALRADEAHFHASIRCAP